MPSAAIVQSSYIPWRGYFDLVASVDTFVFLDDVQMTRRDWRSRNRIKTQSGLKWLTVPCSISRQRTIEETKIDYSENWQKNHLNNFRHAYGACENYHMAADILSRAFNQEFETISELNRFLIGEICSILQLSTDLVSSSDIESDGSKSDKLITILAALGADTYLTGPLALDYLSIQNFKERGVEVYVKTYDYPEYEQPWGEFEPQVSVLDLIANVGKEAPTLISSRRPNELIT